MGAWYESILVRSNELDTIRRILRGLTAGGNRRFLVGPALDNWINIFPNNYGTNGEVAIAIAQELRSDVFHFMVSDDDAFIYYFHRVGVLIDQYNSCPDYFEEVSDSQRNECVGRPHLFRDLFKTEELFNEFAVLLKAEESYAFEQERMSKALELLGLSNALSSYRCFAGR